MRVLSVSSLLAFLLGTFLSGNVAHAESGHDVYRPESLTVYQQPLLVIRVGFTDIQPFYSETDVERLFFGDEGSIASYFFEKSDPRVSVLPDLTDEAGVAASVGRFGLMGLGGWNGDSEPGDNPGGLLGWSQDAAGLNKLVESTAVDQRWPLSTLANSPVKVPLDPYRHGDYLVLEVVGGDNIGDNLIIYRVNGKSSPARTGNTVTALVGEGLLLEVERIIDISRPQTSASFHILADDSVSVTLADGVVAIEGNVKPTGLVSGLVEDIPDSSLLLDDDLSVLLEWPTNAVISSLDGVDLFVMEPGTFRTDWLDGRSGELLDSQDVDAMNMGWLRVLLDQPLARTSGLVRICIAAIADQNAAVGARTRFIEVDGQLVSLRYPLLGSLFSGVPVVSANEVSGHEVSTPVDSGSVSVTSAAPGPGSGSAAGYFSLSWLMMLIGV